LDMIKLGRTGLTVSRVGFGGIPIQRPPFEEAVSTIHRALDLGVNFIDTSIGYGDSEIRIGKAIQGKRDKVVLATKGSWRSREAVENSIDGSLSRFGTDRIDLWQFHNIPSLNDYDAVLRPGGAYTAAKNALSDCKILHLGFSTHNIDVAILGVESGLFETVMFPFDFVAREAEEQLIPLARKNDVGFIAMKPFAGGNIKNARLAMKYLLQFPSVQIIPGIEKAHEIEEISDILAQSWELSVEDNVMMDEIRGELRGIFCRQCLYCMPCQSGVEIWPITIFRGLDHLWPKEQMAAGWIVQAAKSGENCTQCGVCETKCPYSLPIRELIKDNLMFYSSDRHLLRK